MGGESVAERTELADYIPLSDALARRYRQVKRLGTGGQGSVVLAVDSRTDQEVALKALSFAGAQSTVERFMREARALASFVHPNLVRFLEMHTEHDPVILVMEAVPGHSLERVLERQGPMDAERLRRTGRDLAAALELMHAKGCVHRDIKPANVVISEERGPVLVDLGCAYLQEDTDLTRTGVVLGTPSYLAPELLAGAPATPASDVFSLGVMLYQVATGEKPYEIEDLLTAAGGEDLPPEPARHLLELLGPLGGKCLARHPRGRPAATDLVAAWKDPSRPLELSSAVGNRSAGLAPVRRPRPALGVVALAVGAVAASSWWMAGSPPPSSSASTRPPEAPAGPPAPVEAERLVDAAARLAAYHQLPDGALAAANQPYQAARDRVESSSDRFFEATYPLKVKRLLRALLAWVRAAGPGGDGAEGRVLMAEHVTPVAATVARDLDLLRSVCDPSFYEIEYSFNADIANRRKGHRTLVENLRELVTAVVEDWEVLASGPPPPAAAEVAIAQLAEVVGSAGAEGALGRLAARPGATGFLRQLEDFVVTRPPLRGMRLTGVGCPTRRSIVAAATRRTSSGDGPRLVRLVGRLATWWWCDVEPSEVEQAAVAADFEALRGARAIPATARAQARGFWQSADVYWSAVERPEVIHRCLDELRKVLGVAVKGTRARPRPPREKPPDAPRPRGPLAGR